MPPVFKALMSISACILFIAGRIMYARFCKLILDVRSFSDDLLKLLSPIYGGSQNQNRYMWASRKLSAARKPCCQPIGLQDWAKTARYPHIWGVT